MRKVTELLITRRLEAALTKQRIFEIYLNMIEWGDGIFGCEAAARAYFGKACASLDIQEAALMAGAIINPREHSPAKPTKRLLRRQQIILRRMQYKPPRPRRAGAGPAMNRRRARPPVIPVPLPFPIPPPPSNKSNGSATSALEQIADCGLRRDRLVQLTRLAPMKREAQVLLGEAFDAHDAAFARRVDELIAADHDADVRRTRRDRTEKHQVAWLQPIAVDVLADAELIADLPRHRHTVLFVDVADKPAAIEARWIHAAVPVRRASQRERGAREGVSIRAAACRA